MQRYTVDLSNLFSDHRHKAFVGRRHQWKHIACLLDHIRSVFHLDRHIYLTNGENVLFPEREDLEVIQESDQLIRLHCTHERLPPVTKRQRVSHFPNLFCSTLFDSVHPSSSSNGTQQICAPKKTADGESRVAVVNQNGKRKYDALPNLKPGKPSQKVEESSSDSDSDDDDDDDDHVLPKMFVELESISRQDESVQELPKPKRKRIRKRKSKKVEVNTPPKVVVKTYGKSKVPAIVAENGTSPSSHIRFDNVNGEIHVEDIECAAKNEPYRNLNKITVPRVIKAVAQPSVPLTLNDKTPSIPDYEDVPNLNMSDMTNKTRSKQQSRKRKKSVEIKQELIEANTERAASPTWDTELSQAKEAFLATYSGEEFWITLQDALENFPSITIPSVNDIIAYRIDEQSYLALVERADDGESDDRPALKLTLRKLNGVAQTAQPVMVSATLDQLTGIRLVATYQP